MVPFIFVLEPDDEVRPLLKHNLQNWGYELIIALDEADAIQRIQGGHEHFHLILINQAGQSIAQMLEIGSRIRQSSQLEDPVPILVMAERYGADLEGQDIQVSENEYVTYLEDGQQLKVILQRLCPVPDADSAALAQQ
ncbi:hypothetical protein [Pseudanabaena sp. FACHB-2040]|uniref:hypothetical protein n=1 Tax=Pseudanabaena sp. FACHB-2040 TaxID=2692859 RepID=UPI0016848BF1|nr:hypothetical protein [Pseudanabaena sp. FACHB-2040]MBD2256869.1 hypothetical protein [Pseudanabaena sp. FACHB-2040]